MLRFLFNGIFTVALCLASFPRESSAIEVGQLHDFLIDLEGWRQGQPPLGLVGVTRATTDGPAGIGDAFLRVQSDGSGSRGKLLAINTANAGFVSPWTGDDNLADAADYTVWRDMLGQTGVGLAADGTGPRGYPDGIVDTLDYEYWQANFDRLLAMEFANSNAVNSLQVVPEPAAPWLACCAFLFLMTKELTNRIDAYSVDPADRTRIGGFDRVRVPRC